jgi:hypothetical protein
MRGRMSGMRFRKQQFADAVNITLYVLAWFFWTEVARAGMSSEPDRSAIDVYVWQFGVQALSIPFVLYGVYRHTHSSRRFSLRSLLIAIMLVAVLLGLVVWRGNNYLATRS